MTLLRRSLAGMLALLILSPLAAGLAAPAQAEPGFRYWGYSHWEPATGRWQGAETGPDGYVPEDGSVEGWRFAITVGFSVREPRADGDFEAICGTSSAPNSAKRVAVILDYGTAEEAPDGEEPPTPRGACATVPTDATGTDVLQAVAEIRLEEGLVCGIDGYPAQKCAAPVRNASVPERERPVLLELPDADPPTATTGPEPTPGTAATAGAETTTAADTGPDGFPWAPVAVAAVAAAIGVAAAVTLRRRS